MKLFGCTCILLYLFVSCRSWPRYGRPHPLYRGRQQKNENVFANAVLLGLDFNELQNIQAVGGQGFGLGNIGLPNNGFPMNARERQRARQDVNTLTAFGVIDGPEEAGPLGTLVTVSDPPDNPAADAKSGKKRVNKKPKVKGAVKGKNKGNIGSVQKKPRQPVKKQTVIKSAQSTSNNAKIGKTTTKSVIVAGNNSKSKTKIAQKLAIPGQASGKTVKKQTPVTKKPKHRPQNRRPEGDRAENRLVGGEGRSGKRRNWKRGKHGRQPFVPGADPGEGHLAEQGGGDLLDRPVRGRGGRVVVWRTGGEEGPVR